MPQNQTISDINLKSNIVTEEDVKIKKVVPHLEKLGYSADDMQFEHTDIEVFYGKKKTKIRSDIIVNIVYRNKKTPVMVVEVKAPKQRLGELEKEQAISYARLHTPPIKFAVITNGSEWKTFHAGTKKRIKEGVPILSEFASIKYDLSERQIEESKKFVVEGYKTANEIINALEKCHNIMRSNDGFTPLDAFDEMNKLIYTKTQAEKREENKFTEFYFEKECAITENVKLKIDYRKVEITMQRLFDDAIRDYRYNEKIFDETSKIEICGESIYEIVKILDNKGFIETDYEIMGYAFENFLSTVFRGEKLGQYFTPREIVEFAIDMLDVRLGDKIADPCFGSGGFLVQAFKALREKILNMNYNPEIEKKEMKKLSNEYIFGTDINKRLAIACKTNMYIHGDGRTGIHHHDGLSDIGEITENKFDKIFTNPPFGSKIEKKEILKKFCLAGSHRKMQRSEVLFLERCINLLKPEGQMAVVLPDIILNGANNKKTRNFIFDNCRILAIVSLPSQTFVKSGASVKTSVLFLEKKSPLKNYNDKIFMAIPEKIGFDSAGRPDENELGKVIEAFHDFQKGNIFEESGIFFTVSIKDIQDRIDPKTYSPQKKIDTEFELVKLNELVEDLTDKRKFRIKNDEKYFEPTISSKTHTIEVARAKLGKELKVKTRIKIEKGDLVFSKLHTQNGLFAISEREFAATPSFLPVQINKERINEKYLFEILAKAVRFLVLEGDSVGRETYKTRQILNLKIPLPSLEYQKVLLEKINKQKEIIKAMEVAIKHLSAIEEDIFEGFKKIELEKIAKINPDKSESLNDITEEVSFIPMHLLNTDSYNVSFEKRNFDDIKKGYTFFKENDLLFAKITPCMENGKMGIAKNLSNGFGFGSTEIHVIRCSKKISAHYLYFFLKNEKFRQKAKESMTGSAGQQRVSANFLKNFEIPLPSIEIQNKIVEKLDARFAEVEVLKKIKEQAENKRKEILETIFK